MAFLTSREKHTLTLICDTLAPVLAAENGDNPQLFTTCASDLGIPELAEVALEQNLDESFQNQLKIFLHVIESGFLNRLLTGQTASFSDLDLERRSAILRAWGDSDIPQARMAFQALKRLILFMTYAITPDDQPNPMWQAFHYALPSSRARDVPKAIHPLMVTAPTTLYTDVLVIGSGAGGGVIAGELSAAGLDVIVVEKGGYFTEADFTGCELDSTDHLLERRGMFATTDLGILVLAGNALGGGTLINWSASLRPPEYVLWEWETKFGFYGAGGLAFQRSLDAVAARINVNSEESQCNRQNSILAAGCEALGYEVSVIPRNVKGCEDCGFCNFGCPFGAKQSTLKTYLQDAHERGARILVQAHVDRVLHHRGLVSGAQVTVQGEDGIPREVTIQAKTVVVTAGAIHTPALLMRSGLTNANIGANLRLHPTTVIYGLFDKPVSGWQGPPMTRYTRQFADLDGRGYGIRLETAPVHPGIAALGLQWASGRQHKTMMQQLDRLANIIIITRDYHGGRVKTDKRGQPVLDYQISPYDARHMMRGILEALRIQKAAGAIEVASPHHKRLIYRPSPNGEFSGFLAQVQKAGIEDNALPLFSAHQMSSCRIGGNSALGAISPEGESYEVKNLFVADGSVLPTASGVNPMLTIMGVAHYIAQGIKGR